MANKLGIHLVVVFVLGLLVYLATMPLTVALEDDGLFIMSSYFNGVSHPPGYPLHSLIGKVFTLVPISTVAARVHAVSSFFAALTCMVVWLLIYELFKNRAVAYVGALSLAFSSTFWSQAIIAEVYTLNTFFYFLLLFLCWKASPYNTESNINSFKLVYVCAFIYGLSLTNHWPLILLSSLSFLILLWPRIVQSPTLLVKSIAFILLGLVPYAWLVYNSQLSPLISFTGPIDSWSEFLDFVTRTRYAEVDSSTSAGLSDKIAFLGFYSKQLAHQFAYIGLVPVITGLFVQFKYFKKPLIYALLAGFLGNSIALILLLDFDYELINRSVISVYFLVSYGIATIWLATGFYFFFVCLRQRQLAHVQALLVIASILFVFSIFIYNFETNNRHDYTWAKQYATTVLKLLPRDAVLILDDDINVGTIGHTHFVDSIRPDVTILSSKALVFSNRLYDPSKYKDVEAKPVLDKYLREESRPVFTTSADKNTYQHDYWLIRGFDKTIEPGKHLMHVGAFNKEYLEHIISHNIRTDTWTSYHRQKLLNAATPFIIESILRGDTSNTLTNALLLSMSSLDGLLEAIHYIKTRKAFSSFGGQESLLNRAEVLSKKTDNKVSVADYHRLRALLGKEQGNIKIYEQHLLDSLYAWPNENNISFEMLHTFYTENNRNKDFSDLLNNFDSTIIKKYSPTESDVVE